MKDELLLRITEKYSFFGFFFYIIIPYFFIISAYVGGINSNVLHLISVCYFIISIFLTITEIRNLSEVSFYPTYIEKKYLYRSKIEKYSNSEVFIEVQRPSMYIADAFIHVSKLNKKDFIIGYKFPRDYKAFEFYVKSKKYYKWVIYSKWFKENLKKYQKKKEILGLN